MSSISISVIAVEELELPWCEEKNLTGCGGRKNKPTVFCKVIK